MKAVVQRVLQASVSVDGKVISSIGQGLCVLVGITREDTPIELDWMVRKILNLRLFDGDDGKKWDKSVMDKKLEVLCVSQFTLSVILKGNKPDFHEAMTPELSQDVYNEFLKQMGEAYSPEKIKSGEFGAYMQVNIQNDGPVTIPLETSETLKSDPKLLKKFNNPRKVPLDKSKEAPGFSLDRMLQRPQRML